MGYHDRFCAPIMREVRLAPHPDTYESDANADGSDVPDLYR